MYTHNCSYGAGVGVDFVRGNGPESVLSFINVVWLRQVRAVAARGLHDAHSWFCDLQLSQMSFINVVSLRQVTAIAKLYSVAMCILVLQCDVGNSSRFKPKLCA